MRGKIRHSLLGMTLVAATVAAPQVTSTAGAQAWGGFTATSAPSGLNAGGPNNAPAFTAAVTNDLGGDGVDLFVSNHASRSEFLNDWEDTADVFDDTSLASDGFDSHGAAFTDLDGDGDEDMIETSGRDHNTRLFRNNNGTMTEISTGTGLEDFAGRGRTVLNVDIDGDGDMDALIVNLDRTLLSCDDGDSDADAMTPECFDHSDGVGTTDDPEPSEVYLNNGNGTTFTKMADPGMVINDGSIRYANLTSTGPGTDQVIITSNSFSVAIETVATGTGTLTSAPNPVNQTLGLDDNASNLRDIALGDLDGDLSPEFVVARQDDLLATDNEGAFDMDVPPNPIGDGTPDLLGALALGIGQVSTSSLVSEAIVDISADAKIDNCRTIALADYDNDADLDIFGGCMMEEKPGAGVSAADNVNVILLNDGNGAFTLGASSLIPATAALGTATVAINADFNDDGWIDTYLGGSYDFAPGEDFIFMNQGGTSNNYLKVDLIGSNPDAMGAQVFVGSNKWQVRETGHRTHRGQDMKTLHFGLGTQSTIAPLEIMWPDGTFERCQAEGINMTVTITQGSDSCVEQTKSGLLAAIGTTPDTTPIEQPLFCNGLEVTVDMSKDEVPTSGDDVIRGTSGDDVINGFQGADTICALQGNDTINAGDGFDKVFAGQGNDKLNGGVGNDLLVGGPGDDTINGGNGNDRIQGGDGADLMKGQNGLDRIAGGNGNDTLYGGKFADELFGNLGRDSLFGDEGNDVLRGGAWIDTFDGGTGTDGCTLTDPSGNIETRVSCETGVFGL